MKKIVTKDVIVSAVISFLAVNYIYDKKEIKVLKDLVESKEKIIALQKEVMENALHLIDINSEYIDTLTGNPVEEEEE